LDKDEDAILRLIESGDLLWAWNVAAKATRGAKEMRVLPKCVGDFAAGRECRIEFEDVVQALTRGETETLAASEVSAVLNVSSTQVYNLIASRQLMALSTWRTGPGGSARVSVDSFTRFLRERAWPVPVPADD